MSNKDKYFKEIQELCRGMGECPQCPYLCNRDPEDCTLSSIPSVRNAVEVMDMISTLLRRVRDREETDARRGDDVTKH